MSAEAARREPSTAKKLLFSALVLVLFWTVVEVACAIAWASIVPDRFEDQADVPIRFGMTNWPDIVEKDPWLFWQLKPDVTTPANRGRMSGFVSNGDRMRNPDVPVDREPLDFRVLALGDSITFGWGVRYEEAYPTVLHELLHDAIPERRVQVLNAACSGYTAHQGVEVLERRGLKYRPDVIAVWFGWNDAAFWDGMTDAEHARLFARAHWLSRSATYRLLAYRWRKSAHRSARRERKTTAPPLQRVPPADYRARLREIVDLARGTEVEPGSGRGARVVLIQGAYDHQLRTAREGVEVDLDAHQQATAAVARELDLPMLSVLDALRDAGADEQVFLDKGHLDPTGLRIVAEDLLALLAARDLLPEPPRKAGAGS